MAYCEQLAERIRVIFDELGVKFVEKKMMGGLCYMVDSKMCVGILEIDLMARIGPDAYEEALKQSGCEEMDFTGRPMKGFVYVRAPAISTKPKLRKWLKLALTYNPIAKASKKRKKKTSKKANRKSVAKKKIVKRRGK